MHANPELFEAVKPSFSAKVAPRGLNRGTTSQDLVSQSLDRPKGSYTQVNNPPLARGAFRNTRARGVFPEASLQPVCDDSWRRDVERHELSESRSARRVLVAHGPSPRGIQIGIHRAEGGGPAGL